MLLFFFLFELALTEPECPRYSVAFDFQECNPNLRSQCPAGFACRRGNDTKNPSRNFFLCCDNSVMSLQDWFTEASLVPQVFPQGPLQKINNIRLTPVEPNAQFPQVHIGDEVVVLSYPTYVTSMVDQITFTTAPQQGGYLHYMTIVDPGFHPTAIFLNYNQPSTGSKTVNSMSGSNVKVVAYVDNSTIVPVRDSYRALYVALVFQTQVPITLGSGSNFSYPDGTVESTDSRAMMNGCSDVTCLLSNTTLGRDLGQPIAGTMFYLTTLRTLFDTNAQHPNLSTSLSLFSAFLLLLVRFF